MENTQKVSKECLKKSGSTYPSSCNFIKIKGMGKTARMVFSGVLRPKATYRWTPVAKAGALPCIGDIVTKLMDTPRCPNYNLELFLTV